MSKSARIAIVGGGVSGVSAAETLGKHGFTNVVVYEAGSMLVPLQHAVRRPDHVYDLDLIYVPALSWKGSGIEPRYEEVLQEYDQELVPVTEFSHLSRENWYENASAMHTIRDGCLVPELHEYFTVQLAPEAGRQRLYEIQRFVKDYASFFQVNQYRGVHACLANAIAYHNETFHDWARRNDYTILYQGVAHILHLYGNFPVGNSPACQVLMLLANKMPSILGPSLVLAASHPDFESWLRESPHGPITDTMYLWFAQVAMDMPAFMRRFRYGYANFFASIVLKNRIDYRTNARVQRLVPSEDPTTGKSITQIQFTDAAVPMTTVDHVFVAGRPDQVHSILPESHPFHSLYGDVARHAEETTLRSGVYGVAVLRFEISRDAGFVANDRFVIDHQKHQVPMYEGNLSAPVNLMRMTKSGDANIMTCVFQTQIDLVDSALERQLLYHEIGLYGFTDLDVLKLVHYPKTPTRVPVDAIASGWYDRAEEAQGHQQLYFIGETFSGHGVPTTYLHTRDWLVRTFHLTPNAPSVSSVWTPPTQQEFKPLVVNISADLAQMGT